MASKQHDIKNLMLQVSEGSIGNKPASTNRNANNVIYFANAKKLKSTIGLTLESDNKQADFPSSYQTSKDDKPLPNEPTFLYQNEQNLMISQISQAIEKDSFVLHYQPQYSMDNQRIVGMEALLRMQSENGELISPDLFVPVAEEHGFIIPVGNWVIHEACQQLRRWQDSGYQTVRMAINVSPKQLTDEAIIDVITESVTEAGIQFSDLELEITEQSIIDNMSVAVKVLNELSKKGVRIAIDDFGTGYSAFSYLTQLPLNVIKIDRTFVSGAPSNIKACQVIKGIVNLAKSLDLEVVVEGIETDAQQQFIASIGCDMGQGFGFARPAEADKVESSWLAKN